MSSLSKRFMVHPLILTYEKDHPQTCQEIVQILTERYLDPHNRGYQVWTKSLLECLDLQNG